MVNRAMVMCALSLVGARVGSSGESRTFEKRVPLAAGGTVRIENVAGSVKVVGWSESAVQVKATLGSSVDRVDVEARSSSIEIKVVLPRNSRGDSEARLEVLIPVGARLEVETVSADIDATDVQGAVELESVSGGIVVRGGSTEAELATVSGAVELRSSSAVTQGKLESVSGRLVFVGDLARNGRLRMNTVSGAIDVQLPTGVSAEVEATTFSGAIESSQEPTSSEPSFTGGGDQTFHLGDGSARAKLNSFSGRVKLDLGAR